MDKLTPDQRSRVMSRVKGKDTSPELRVRRMLHAMGYRFRLHIRDLPGKPDIVLPKYRTCVFVHGCFWHQHEGCKRATLPDTRREFWIEKFARNRQRDEAVAGRLTQAAWRVCVIWECETKTDTSLRAAIERCLAGMAMGDEGAVVETAVSAGINI